MVSKGTKQIIIVGAVLVGGYFLYSAITGKKWFGTMGTRMYPSMAPVGGPYPSPTPFRNVNVF